ncbi:MAG: hypothetical protein V2A76_03915 [Planctomycetota bacterium]
MVSNSRPEQDVRECPSVPTERAVRPLFQQTISMGTCEARQDLAYHKCHRCEYRETARVRRELNRLHVL